MSKGTQQAQPGFQGQIATEGGKGEGDGDPTGRPAPGPPQSDSGLEEGSHRGRRRCLRLRSGPEGQERRRPGHPVVPGDRPTQGGAGFLVGEVRSMSLAKRRGDGGPGASIVVDSAAGRTAGSGPFQPVLSTQGSLPARTWP